MSFSFTSSYYNTPREQVYPQYCRVRMPAQSRPVGAAGMFDRQQQALRSLFNAQQETLRTGFFEPQQRALRSLFNRQQKGLRDAFDKQQSALREAFGAFYFRDAETYYDRNLQDAFKKQQRALRGGFNAQQRALGGAFNKQQKALSQGLSLLRDADTFMVVDRPRTLSNYQTAADANYGPSGKSDAVLSNWKRTTLFDSRNPNTPVLDAIPYGQRTPYNYPKEAEANGFYNLNDTVSRPHAGMNGRVMSSMNFTKPLPTGARYVRERINDAGDDVELEEIEPGIYKPFKFEPNDAFSADIYRDYGVVDDGYDMTEGVIQAADMPMSYQLNRRKGRCGNLPLPTPAFPIMGNNIANNLRNAAHNTLPFAAGVNRPSQRRTPQSLIANEWMEGA